MRNHGVVRDYQVNHCTFLQWSDPWEIPTYARTVSDYTDQQATRNTKTVFLREELAAYGYDPVNQQAKHLGPYQMKKLVKCKKVKEYKKF